MPPTNHTRLVLTHTYTHTTKHACLVQIWPTQIVTSSITKLNFKNNKLTSWPAWMCERISSNVQSLSLESNQLASLPLVFGTLGGLTKLNLSQNHLKSLPASFSDLTNLVKLKISNNEFNIVPPPVFELPNLVNLQAFGNEFTALPAQLQNLTKMRSLNLSNNQLRTLPPEVSFVCIYCDRSEHSPRLSTYSVGSHEYTYICQWFSRTCISVAGGGTHGAYRPAAVAQRS